MYEDLVFLFDFFFCTKPNVDIYIFSFAICKHDVFM